MPRNANAGAADPYDLQTIFGDRAALEGLDPNGPPSLRLLRSAPPARSVALLPGSFNPPTAAHLLLAERALGEGFDCVAFVLARSTVGKGSGGLIAEDRLLALRSVAVPPHVVVAVSSCGLYADQAEAAALAFSGARIVLLVGSDKIEQIFDDRWYEDRDVALERLFAHASLIVAPRADDGDRVREIIESDRNRRWADRVSVLPLHPAVSDLSSSRVRGLLQAGADPAGLLPPSVAALLAEVRAFGVPLALADGYVDAYMIRCRLLDSLWRARESVGRETDLRALVALGIDPGRRGAALREELGRAQPDAAAVLAVASGM